MSDEPKPPMTDERLAELRRLGEAFIEYFGPDATNLQEAVAEIDRLRKAEADRTAAHEAWKQYADDLERRMLRDFGK